MQNEEGKRCQTKISQVGEYLGGHDSRAIAVMHAYVDGEDFSGQQLDAALRQLLGGFRLPGAPMTSLAACFELR